MRACAACATSCTKPGKADRALSRVQKESPSGPQPGGRVAWPPPGAQSVCFRGSWRAKIAPAGLPDRPLEIRSGPGQLQGRSWGGVCPNSVSNSASARARTASGRWITRPHSRSVSPGHLLVASRAHLAADAALRRREIEVVNGRLRPSVVSRTGSMRVVMAQTTSFQSRTSHRHPRRR